MEEAIRPWADLPEHMAELVLELLPLVGYIRFSAVCSRWQSIQEEHRRRHSPSPPPMRHPLPWLVIPCPPDTDDKDTTDKEEEGVLDCYSPVENKNYLLPLPPVPRFRDVRCLNSFRDLSCIHSFRYISCIHSFRGWLLMISHKLYTPYDLPSFSAQPILFNPVTRSQILLPPMLAAPRCPLVGAMSAPPTDPECTILLTMGFGPFLHRLSGGGGWMRVGDPRQDETTGASDALFCRGKFIISYQGLSMLGIIDPLLLEPMQQLRIVNFAGPGHLILRQSDQSFCLVENDGEVLLVETLWVPGDYYHNSRPKEFRVYKTDASWEKWMRVETLGDRAVFLNFHCALSVVATDMGFNKNTIYCCFWYDSSFLCWAFDLETGGWIDGALFSFKEDERLWGYSCWFLPTLDCADTTQASKPLALC